MNEDVGQPGGGVDARPIALPLGGHCHPRHQIHAGRRHALEGDFVRFDRHAAGGIGDDRHIPTFARRLDRRHCDADLRPQPGDDQLPAACGLGRVDHFFVFPRVDERAIYDFLAGKDIGDLGKDDAAPRRDHARQNRGHAEDLGGLCQRRRIVDHGMRVVAVQVGELIRLVVDQDEYRILRTEKRIEAITKSH